MPKDKHLKPIQLNQIVTIRGVVSTLSSDGISIEVDGVRDGFLIVRPELVEVEEVT